MKEIKGRIHSFQSLGTVDGPGIRFVVFMQGCNLRCGCCHNPDTWDINGGEEFSAKEVVSKAERFKSYFKDNGGITVSGGEPLLQSKFIFELFSLCKEKGINTCLDTSGSILNNDAKNLLKVTDRVLLDVKYVDNDKYLKHVGCKLDNVIEFLAYVNELNIPVTVRQVIIPTINSDVESVTKLKDLVKQFPSVDKIELLPFKKICEVKYKKMGIPFPFESIPTPTEELMQQLNAILSE